MDNLNYIDIMIQSLQKKVKILEMLIELNHQQRLLILDENVGPDEVEKNMDRKAGLIEELNVLDSGFEKLFERVKDELHANKSGYMDEIFTMQELIRLITDKSTTIQSQELRNKEEMAKKFSSVRRQVKGVRDSQRVIKNYYNNMLNKSYPEPQFLDNKK